MTQRIFFDGMNLSLERGTGIATYTRVLTRMARELGHEVGVVYSAPQAPAKHPLLREISFFDERRAMRIPRALDALNHLTDHFRCRFGIAPIPVDLSGTVVTRQFEGRLPTQDHVFVARNLFRNASGYFAVTRRFVDLAFDHPPDIFHWTYQLPLRARKARNIYTIHDLVPLRLPFATLDDKRHMFRLLRKIAAEADHIVTVSENSKRDIIALLGVPEARVTNTYEAVAFPQEYLDRPESAVAEHLAGSFGLDFGNYLLFFGAFEPKKNVVRLIEAYLASSVDVPLVLVASGGWQNDEETRLLAERRDRQFEDERSGSRLKRRMYRLDYVSTARLVTLIRGARAVLFPSLYEGFGLPVLEAMMLGTPVVASREASLPEIAGDAALLVNPYEVADIARAIATIAGDADLRAELAKRGRERAALFSLERYRERLAALYDSLR